MINTTNSLPLMVEILGELRNQFKLESKFERRMREVKQNTRWNSRGILTPYTSQLDFSHFAVPEQGAILGGYLTERIKLKQQMRSIWKSIMLTGSIQRIADSEFISLQKEYPSEAGNLAGLAKTATGRAYEIFLEENLPIYQRLKNFYAINGGDTSAIGTVSGVPTGNVVPFSWATTDNGNRFFQKGMRIQFYDTSAVAHRTLSTDYTAPRAASSQYSMVANKVDPRSTVNIANNGAVTFDMLPTVALAAGDTAHIIQGRNAMPQGFLYWVSDVGDLLGESGVIARSAVPEILTGFVQDNGGSTDLTPMLMLEMKSFLEGRAGEDMPVKLEIWANKALAYKYALFGMNSAGAGTQFNVQRFRDTGALGNIDVGTEIDGNTFSGVPIVIDSDVPPSKLLWVDWMGWEVDVQTPDSIYEFHQNQSAYQFANAFGEPTDAKQVTFFSEYNYRCTRIKTQGIQPNLSYDAKHISYA